MKKELKNKILSEMVAQRKLYNNDSEFANKLGISKSLYSRIKNGEHDIVADIKLLEIGKTLLVDTYDLGWKIAKTNFYEYMFQQLSFCKENGISTIFCDKTDLGKTVTSKDFARKTRNAVYIHCGFHKTKIRLIKKIAQEFGLETRGSYHDVLIRLSLHLNIVDTPIIILDEAGDVSYEAFLELKALWNESEYSCSWVLVGADGLKKKIERGILGEKVGFSEMFRRHGSKYQRYTSEDELERNVDIQEDAAKIIRLNFGKSVNVNSMLGKIDNSLTRIYTEYVKLKRKQGGDNE